MISTTPFCNSRQGTLQPLESDWMVSTIRRVPTWYSCPKVLPVGQGISGDRAQANTGIGPTGYFVSFTLTGTGSGSAKSPLP